MNHSDQYREGYRQGFLMGYQKALADCRVAQADLPENPALMSSLEALGLSPRALHCLRQAGCASLEDICRLSDRQIDTMHNLGVKTAAEIAGILDDHGLRTTSWARYRPVRPD